MALPHPPSEVLRRRDMAVPRIAVARWRGVRLGRLAAYHERLTEAGLLPIDVHDRRALDGCQGLLLTGGRDIDPSLYGEQPHDENDTPDPARDAFELDLLRHALEADMPVLAICRGHQLLNVCLGGSLLQHIESGEHVAYADAPHPSRTHVVTIEDGTRLASSLGAGVIEVNSRHHQAVTPERVAAGLRVTGMSADGLVEAVESTHHALVVGVQWHPERIEPGVRDFDAASRRLFAAFAAATRET